MRKLATLFALGLMIMAFAAPPTALGFIHEMIGAECRAVDEEVIPPGQARDGQSFVRALQATGIIESIDTSVPGEVTVNFDLSKPASKYISEGFDLRITDGFGPGVDLILSPLPFADFDFAAYANCHVLNP